MKTILYLMTPAADYTWPCQCVTVALRKRISDNDIRQLGWWWMVYFSMGWGDLYPSHGSCTTKKKCVTRYMTILYQVAFFSDCCTSTAKWWCCPEPTDFQCNTCVNPSDWYDPAWMKVILLTKPLYPMISSWFCWLYIPYIIKNPRAIWVNTTYVG